MSEPSKYARERAREHSHPEACATNGVFVATRVCSMNKLCASCRRLATLIDKVREDLAAENERLRGGSAESIPFRDCTDCGRAMVWSNPEQDCPTWMCPRCCHQRMKTAEARIARLEAALWKYGQHSRGCPSRNADRCSCGLRTALESEADRE